MPETPAPNAALAARAALEARLLKNQQAKRRPAIGPRPPSAAIPLSFAQQRIWFLEQLTPGTAQYNVPVVTRLEGPLDVAALERSLTAIVERHEILRTAYRNNGGDPVQVVNPARETPLAVVDLRGITEEERSGHLEELLRAETERPFALDAGAMLRPSLFVLSGDRHVLVLMLHHIAADGWSAGILMKELAAFYNAFACGKEPSLPPLAVQYADFAVWQRGWLAGETLETQVAYWKKQLEGVGVLELPLSRPRDGETEGGRVAVTVPAPAAAALKELARSEGATLYMAALAVFQAMLARYTGQTDIAVGTPVAGRNWREIEPLVGFFVNTLVMRADASGDPTFREFLRRVKQVALDAYSHQDIPFEKLVEELNPPRDTFLTPFFQTMLMFQNIPGEEKSFLDLTLRPQPVEWAGAKFDLTLTLAERDGGLKASFVYNARLFDADTIERMAGHFVTLLEHAAEAPETPIGQLRLLSAAERELLIEELNATASEYPREASVADLLDGQAARTPELPAVLYEGVETSYSEMARQAARIAAYLQSAGAGPGALVGIHLDRTPDMIAAVWGVLKSGAAYVPLDPAFPAERLAMMIEDSGMLAVLTSSRLEAALLKRPEFVISLDADQEKIERAHPDGSVRPAGPEDLAYVIYTSGSTGRPKGVEVPHRAVVNFLHSMARQPGCGPSDTLLAVTTLSFDIAGLELLLPLMTGARIALAPRDKAADGPRLAELIESSKATVMQATPATWRMLVDSGWKGAPGLRVLCGGEALPETLAAELLPRCAELWNMYGPTETTIWSSVARVRRGEPITLGAPIANTQFYVLDRNREPLPPGVAGELFIGGDGVARGYRERPDLTLEKFVPNPFRSGERMYRTGDLVRMAASGAIEYLGRMDFQVKIRGFRIELGEIESALLSYPGVTEAVAIARDDQAGGKRLLAYLTAPGLQPSAKELRQWLRQTLPEYMVPAAFVTLDALPRTPNGKIDRKALPDPSIEAEAKPAETGDPFQMQLAAVWQRVLGSGPVGPRDNFFDLGGHSLLAVRVVNEIQKTFGIALPLAAFFESPTVEKMARVLREGAKGKPMPVLIPIQPNGTKLPLFCVSRPNVNALGYAFLSRHLGPDQPMYGLQATIRNANVEPFTQVEYERKAAAYIRAMREVQPHGPYLLTGFCEGAHIAFEMVRQLERAGEPVGMLAVLDVWPMENTRNLPMFALYIRHEMLRAFLKQDRRMQMTRVKNKLKKLMFWNRKPAAGSPTAPRTGGAKVVKLEPLYQRMTDRYWPGRLYQEPRCRTPITVFRMRDQAYWRINDRTMAWKRRTRSAVTVIDLVGQHRLILREPYVQVVAREMAGILDEVNRKHIAWKQDSGGDGVEEATPAAGAA